MTETKTNKETETESKKAGRISLAKAFEGKKEQPDFFFGKSDNALLIRLLRDNQRFGYEPTRGFLRELQFRLKTDKFELEEEQEVSNYLKGYTYVLE